MNFFNILQSLYCKDRIDLNPDIGMNIALMKWLSYDTDNLETLSRIAPFLYYINPKRFFYLLYLSIPPKSKAPFLKRRLKDKTKKEDKVYDKVKYVLNWSTKELEWNKPILELVLIKKDWKRKLGVK